MIMIWNYWFTEISISLLEEWIDISDLPWLFGPQNHLSKLVHVLFVHGFSHQSHHLFQFNVGLLLQSKQMNFTSAFSALFQNELPWWDDSHLVADQYWHSLGHELHHGGWILVLISIHENVIFVYHQFILAVSSFKGHSNSHSKIKV